MNMRKCEFACWRWKSDWKECRNGLRWWRRSFNVISPIEASMIAIPSTSFIIGEISIPSSSGMKGCLCLALNHFGTPFNRSSIFNMRIRTFACSWKQHWIDEKREERGKNMHTVTLKFFNQSVLFPYQSVLLFNQSVLFPYQSVFCSSIRVSFSHTKVSSALLSVFFCLCLIDRTTENNNKCIQMHPNASKCIQRELVHRLHLVQWVQQKVQKRPSGCNKARVLTSCIDFTFCHACFLHLLFLNLHRRLLRSFQILNQFSVSVSQRITSSVLGQRQTFVPRGNLPT